RHTRSKRDWSSDVCSSDLDDAPVAVEIALQLVENLGRSKDMPDLRVGLASGSVITRLGDVFGPPVNLASRLTTVARRNRVIVDQIGRAACRGRMESENVAG